MTGWSGGEWASIFVPLYNTGMACAEHPTSRPPPWIKTNTGNNEWFDETIGLKIFRLRHCSSCLGTYIAEFGCGQHGPNDVAWKEPFGNNSAARSIGGLNRITFAYGILNKEY
jgi:hypothetical protein